MTEEWRAVPGWEGYYETSNKGRVRSVDRVILNGGKRQFWRGRLLRPSFSAFGYPRVILCRERVKSSFTVHALVLLTFVGPRPEGLETRHLDGNVRNAELTNLCYGTTQENADDRKRHGTAHKIVPVIGEDHYAAVLTETDVRYLRANPHLTREQAGAMFGVSPTTVSAVCLGKTWKHLL